ncbi:MAG: hypothetical protein CME06_06850 [Gemmatimonadetes bacterium]|nr:hypothetical protein [Gemmatimonadota bacterium]
MRPTTEHHRFRVRARALPRIALFALAVLGSSCGEREDEGPSRSLADRLETMDADGDGRVSPAEFAARVERGTSEASEVRFRILDFDGDGFLSVDELGERDASEPKAEPKGEPRGLKKRRSRLHLRQYDSDGDGSLTRNELDQGYDGNDAGRAMRRFVRLDTNSDGVLDTHELRSARMSGSRAPDPSIKRRRRGKR